MAIAIGRAAGPAPDAVGTHDAVPPDRKLATEVVVEAGEQRIGIAGTGDDRRRTGEVIGKRAAGERPARERVLDDVVTAAEALDDAAKLLRLRAVDALEVDDDHQARGRDAATDGLDELS